MNMISFDCEVFVEVMLMRVLVSVLLKGSFPQNNNSVIIYSPSRRSKLARLSFFCGT